MATSAAALQKSLQKMYTDTMVKVQKLANEATEKEMTFNSAEAQKSRAWQERMSNTSHQREVADLQKAGLNPVLSVNSGAQAYSAASASATAKDTSGTAGSMMSSIMSSLGSFVSSKYAADSSAQATKYAANQQRKAAEASAAATRYAANMSYESTKYATDHNKSGSAWGVLSSVADKFGINEKTVKGFYDKYLKPYIKQKSGEFKSWYQVAKTTAVNTGLGHILGSMNIMNTKENRSYLYNYMITNNSVWLNRLNQNKTKQRKFAPPAHTR